MLPNLLARAAAGSVLFAMILLPAAAQAPLPKHGYLPDEQTAVRVAEAILTPIYGEATIAAERPFHATLRGDAWDVNGTLAPNNAGGTAYIRLDQKTAAVLIHFHTK